MVYACTALNEAVGFINFCKNTLKKYFESTSKRQKLYIF